MLFEKIEDENDMTTADEAYGEYMEDGKNTQPIEKLWKDCDI
ncbi:DUF6290 family protein [Dialister sp.]|nr:DUF6290 family protein [Dialister sp.]MEE3453696.1 DUF6290 family protein [Dialister sp.]